MANIHVDALLGANAKLMEHGKFCDLTIECEGRRWKVHKAIVCSASEALERECHSRMKEGFTNEIKHDEFDADTMNRMISYIYKRTYTVDGEEELFDVAARIKARKDMETAEEDETEEAGLDNINQNLVAHVKVYGIADFYQIPTLKHYAAQRFVESAVLVDCIRCEGFVDVVQAVYEHTSSDDTMLRNPLRDYAAQHLEKLMHNEDSAFKRSLGELSPTQDLAFKVLERSMRTSKIRLQEMEKEKKRDKETEIRNLQKSEGRARESMGNLLQEIKRLKFKAWCESCGEDGRVTVRKEGTSTLWVSECKECEAYILDPR